MSGPRFSTEISVGNILSILTVVVVGGMAWGNLDSRVSNLENRFGEIFDRTESLAARQRASENNAARADERVSLILQGLARIESRLERFETRIRENTIQ